MKSKATSFRVMNVLKYKIAQDDLKTREIIKNERYRNDLISRIQRLQPRIQELIDVANVCIKSEIEIDYFHNRKWVEGASGYEKGTFISNPISKNVGFIESSFGCKKNKISFLGISNGCCCSSSYFCTDGTKCFNVIRQNIPYKKKVIKEKPKIDDMEKFLKGFDTFEEQFYKYVDKIVEDINNANKDMDKDIEI